MIKYFSLLHFLIVGSILLLLTSCEFMSYEDYEYEPYDGSISWEKLVNNVEWGNRFDHAAVSFDGKLWILGGYNPGQTFGDTYYEDVWSSTDGENWDLITDHAPWHGRRGHEVVVFNDGSGDALFLIGGYMVNEETGYRQYTNDVWKSFDGKTWTEIKSTEFPPRDSLYQWYPRMEHSCVVKNTGGKEYIYLVAGRSMQDSIDGRFSTIYHNDVWRTPNGKDWERINNNDFGIRGDQAVTINPETGRMFMQGGTHGIIFTSQNFSSHPIEHWEYLWYSDDGQNWIATNDTATWDQSLLWRSSHHLVYFDNSVWSFPGKTTSNVHYHFTEPGQFPIWRLHDNGTWEADSYGVAFDPRHGYGCVVHDNKIWIMGGFTSNSGQSNDVWVGEIIK